MRIIAIIAGVMMLFCPLVSFASPVHRTAENALLPEGKEVSIRTPVEQPRPLYPDCGEIQIGWGTCTVFDGYIDDEWNYATVYDVSDTCGQSDGLPNEPGTVYLYLMKEEQAVYFGIDAVGDSYRDYYDQAGLYFDDNNDGCWPPTGITNEGNIWVVDDLAGGFGIWRWYQDPGCAGNCVNCLDYYGNYTSLGGFYEVYPPIGVSTTSGHVQYEAGIDFGDYADEEWEIQTFLCLGETCGFYVYYLDWYYYDFMGEMPCTGDDRTYIWPCSWPSLIGMPKASVTLTPDATTVEQGGTLGYTIEVTNNTGEDQTFEYWSDVYLWTGEPYKKNPVFDPISGTLKAGQSKSGHITHKVPNNAPLRTYSMCGRIGFHPDDVWDEDCFEFTVVEGNNFGHED
jgi:hypothetical protein